MTVRHMPRHRYTEHACELLQAMYIYLCCYAIWDVGGVWSWLVVAQRKSISAIARYDAAGQVSHVLTISRQGFYHTYMSLVANSATQMQMQAPVNTTPELDLPTSKKVLELARAVMGANFNVNDSLCESLRFALWKLCLMPAYAVAKAPLAWNMCFTLGCLRSHKRLQSSTPM